MKACKVNNNNFMPMYFFSDEIISNMCKGLNTELVKILRLFKLFCAEQLSSLKFSKEVESEERMDDGFACGGREIPRC